MEERLLVCSSIWPQMASIALAYFVTLCLFPGVETEIRSCRLGSWTPVLLMAAFNAADLAGKAAAPAAARRLGAAETFLLALARSVLVPLTVLCAAPRRRPALAHEGWAFALTAALGASNGVLGCAPMVTAPARVGRPLRELAGNLMTLSYSLGLTLGSATAYGLDGLLGPPAARLCPGDHQRVDPGPDNLPFHLFHPQDGLANLTYPMLT